MKISDLPTSKAAAHKHRDHVQITEEKTQPLPVAEVLFEGRLVPLGSSILGSPPLLPWQVAQRPAEESAKPAPMHQEPVASAFTLQTEPDSKSLFMLGFSYAQKGQHDWAVSAYRRAIAISPDARSYYNCGCSRAELGDHQGAAQDYSQAIKLSPDFTKAYYNRAASRTQLQDYSGAVFDLRKVLEDPDFTHKERAKVKLSRTTTLLRAQQAHEPRPLSAPPRLEGRGGLE